MSFPSYGRSIVVVVLPLPARLFRSLIPYSPNLLVVALPSRRATILLGCHGEATRHREIGSCALLVETGGLVLVLVLGEALLSRSGHVTRL
jgi:hypothetical protein